MPDSKHLTIFFMDGTALEIEFPVQSHDFSTLIDAIEKAAESNKLVAEIEGAMYCFPYSSIKYIRVSPCPEVLPETAISGARIVER